MVLRKLLYLFSFLQISLLTFSQSYFPILEQNPSKIKWRKMQITGTPFSVIHNEYSDSLAQLTANYVKKNYLSIGKGIHVTLHPWNIILQNQGVISNGFVSVLAPRVEYFSTKPQNTSLISINNWHELLSSHELRHVYQYELSRKGLGKLGYYLSGNILLAASSALYIPNWLFEGDAVETESRLNPTGRSKIPQFYMPLYAYLHEYGVPSYAKLMAKSYRELVPNHYVFGQALSQSFLNRYGPESIDQLWHDTFKKMKPFAFSKAVKKLTDKNIDDFSYELFSKLKDSAKVYAKKLTDSTTLLTPEIKKGFTQFEYPQWIGYESFVAIKSGLSNIPTLVKFNGSTEVELAKLGPKAEDGMLSANKDFVVFSELTFHPRWAQKQGSRIVVYDLKKNTKQYWDIGLKWMSPSLSPDSRYLSLLQQNDDGSSEIIVFDFQTQEIINSYPIGINKQAIHPRISTENRLVFIELFDYRKKIIVWDWKKNSVVAKIDLGQNNMGSPFLKDGKVYFNLPQNGLDQLACWDFEQNKLYGLTNSIWGAYSPSLSDFGQRLIYSNYTAKGLQIVEKKLSLDRLLPITTSIEPPFSKIDSSESVKYSSKKFRQWLNIYTWGPLAASQNNQLEISVSSKNILNTFQFGAGLLYNSNERNWGQFAKFSIQKWFPVLDFSFLGTNRTTSLYVDKKMPLDTLISDKWRQNKFDLGIRLPFNLTHSAFQENLTLINNYSLMQVQGYQLPLRYTTEAFDGTYFSIINQITYYKLLNKSALDVQNRKGILLNLYWQSMPKAQEIRAELWAFQARLYLPGLAKHDGIALRYGYQQQMQGNYYFSSPLQIPRGDLYKNFQSYHTFSLDYKFPIANTDINWGKWLYIKRIKGNLFFDQGIGLNTSKEMNTQVNFQSFGVDLSSQISFMRFSQTLELGVRCLYKPQINAFEVYPLILDIAF